MKINKYLSEWVVEQVAKCSLETMTWHQELYRGVIDYDPDAPLIANDEHDVFGPYPGLCFSWNHSIFQYFGEGRGMVAWGPLRIVKLTKMLADLIGAVSGSGIDGDGIDETLLDVIDVDINDYEQVDEYGLATVVLAALDTQFPGYHAIQWYPYSGQPNNEDEVYINERGLSILNGYGLDNPPQVQEYYTSKPMQSQREAIVTLVRAEMMAIAKGLMIDWSNVKGLLVETELNVYDTNSEPTSFDFDATITLVNGTTIMVNSGIGRLDPLEILQYQKPEVDVIT